jgi:hypothetical protein
MAAIQNHPLPAPPPHQNRYYPPQSNNFSQPQQQQQQQPQPQQKQQQHQQYQQQQAQPKSRSFSFRSDKSNKSSGSQKVAIYETSAEKEAKRLHSKADPTLAMNEAEPGKRNIPSTYLTRKKKNENEKKKDIRNVVLDANSLLLARSCRSGDG